MENLRFFKVNGQTAMIIDKSASIIYAVANHHLSWLVYNKPLITGAVLGECRVMFKENGFSWEAEIATDSFSMGFWNDALHQTSSFSTDVKMRMDSKIIIMKSPYYERIKEDLARRGRIDVDPRHVEAYIRLVGKTMDGLTEIQFRREISIGMSCIEVYGLVNAESCAKSFGL